MFGLVELSHWADSYTTSIYSAEKLEAMIETQGDVMVEARVGRPARLPAPRPEGIDKDIERGDSLLLGTTAGAAVSEESND